MKNQQMEVRIDPELTITVGYKTYMGKVEPILKHGNWLREIRGLSPITMKSILEKADFWEFVIERNTQNILNTHKAESGSYIQGVESTLCIDSFKDNRGELEYTKLMKEFPDLIKLQNRGKLENRGYWADSHILLKIAAMFDNDINNCFIKGGILELRDEGGEQFKALNSLIETYMRNPSTWEKIIKMHNEDCKSVGTNSQTLSYSTSDELPVDSRGQIKYSDILKTGYLDAVVSQQTRGKLVNRGTWMELILLLDLATRLDADLWYVLYKSFVAEFPVD